LKRRFKSKRALCMSDAAGLTNFFKVQTIGAALACNAATTLGLSPCRYRP
jgi:hypothetical protein